MPYLDGSEIDSLLTKGKPIWIRNNVRSVILISFYDSSGKEEPLRLPPVKEPFCLTSYISPSMIRENSTLRRLISEGHLSLFDPDDAEVKGFRSSKALKSVVNKTETPKGEDDSEPDLDPEDELISASTNIAYWCDATASGDMKIGEFMQKITTEKENLTEDDLAYIIKTVKNEDVNTFATNTLAELREAKSGVVSESDGDEEDAPTIEEAAKEILARTRIQNNNITSDPGKGAKIEHATMSAADRKNLRTSINK